MSRLQADVYETRRLLSEEGGVSREQENVDRAKEAARSHIMIFNAPEDVVTFMRGWLTRDLGDEGRLGVYQKLVRTAANELWQERG